MCIRTIISFLVFTVMLAGPICLLAQSSAPQPGYGSTSPGFQQTPQTAPTATIPQYNVSQPSTNPQFQQQQQYPQQQQYLNTPGATQPNTSPAVTGHNPNQGQIQPARPLGAMSGTNAPQASQQQQPVQNATMAGPFELTPFEQQRLDVFLSNWELKCQNINVMECEFQKYFYDGMVASSDGTPMPAYVTYGIAKYAKPDKGYYWEQGEVQQNGPAKGLRESKMICDGKSYYIFDYTKKEIIEFPLPENMKGSRNLDSPIMFIVGANPRELKERFFLRLIDHPNKDYIVLEAYPKQMDDAKSFRMVQMIVYTNSYEPYGMRQYSNGSDFVTYIITKSSINPKVSAFERFRGAIIGKDEFDSVLRTVPSDWTHRIDNGLLQANAGPQSESGMR